MTPVKKLARRWNSVLPRLVRLDKRKSWEVCKTKWSDFLMIIMVDKKYMNRLGSLGGLQTYVLYGKCD